MSLEFIYGKETLDKIASTNLLIVGVGGIGCELIKVLTNSGYRRFTLIDLDSIEMTNLNRQFLFRRKHIGMSKSEVGKESALLKDPKLEITALHASIFDFDVTFFKQFHMVYCALDNNAAREQLGKMCIKANVVMIDAGTGGYNG